MGDRLDKFLQRGMDEASGLLVDDLLDAECLRRSPIRWALGTGGRVIAAPWGRLRGRASEAKDRIGTLLRSTYKSTAPRLLPTDSADEAVRFDVAQAVYGRSDTDLAAEQATTHTAFLFYLAALVGLIAVGIASYGMYSTALPWWLDIMARFAATPAALALAMRAAFYNWQLRTRRLGSLRKWLMDPNSWWTWPPPGNGGMSGSMPATLVLLVSGALTASILAGAPADAAAQTATASSIVSQALATPPSTDFWYQLLSMVFPGVGPLNGTVTPISNGIAEGFASMLAVLMAIAAMFMSYQTVIATAATAHDGEVMGKRWHTMFAPIRVAYGFGVLAPVVKGYCVLQIMVIWLAVVSGQVGNIIWNGFVDGLAGGKIEEPRLQESVALIKDGMVLELCYAALESLERGSRGSLSPAVAASLPAWPTTYAPGPLSASNNMATRGVKAVVHGFLWLWDSSSNKGTNSWGTHEAVWDYGRCGTITGAFALPGDLGSDDDVIAMDTARIKALDKLRASLRSIAQEVVAGVSPGSGKSVMDVLTPNTFREIVDAKKVYDVTITSAASAYVNGANSVTFDEFKKAAKSAGWIAAGPYYSTLGRMSSEAVSVVGTQATVNNGSTMQTLMTDPWLSKLLSSALGHYQSWWDHNLTVTANADLSSSAARAGLYSHDNGLSEVAWIAGGFNSDNPISRLAYRLTMVTPGKGVALQDMVDFGNNIIDAAWTGALAYVGVTKAVRNIPYVGTLLSAKDKLDSIGGAKADALTAASAFILLLGIAMLLCGIFHAFVLPMLPFIHFSFAVMGILVTVVEGVIAAPLLAFAHVRMDGQDFIDQHQKPGYDMAFNLFLRIPLTLFGLFFSILVMEAMIWLLARTLFAAMASASAANTFGLFGTLTYVVMIGVLNYQIATRCFHLITQIPDRVCRWFGVGGGHNDESQHVGGALGMVVNHTRSGLDAGAGAVKAAAAAKQPGSAALDALKKAAGETADGADAAVTRAGDASGASKVTGAAAQAADQRPSVDVSTSSQGDNDITKSGAGQGGGTAIP
ncbi:DotA/TraY family protein [Azospirillum melinis]|uniref:DotA/TraY family protein n=1 Tax=Azospirillum melinis TaxID=328839 RepID=UPI0037570272